MANNSIKLLIDLLDSIIQSSGLIQHHEKEPGEKGKTRIENLEADYRS